jgi:peptide deformylase
MKLIPWNSPILKEPLPPFDFTKHTKEEIDKFVEDMFTACEQWNGIGLSANQVGINTRMFVIRMKHTDPDVVGRHIDFKQEYFNPYIVSTQGPDELFEEGCLSRPGLWLKVKRPTFVRVKYWTKDGEEKHEVLDGILARVWQHEYDHMEGVDFTERVSKVKLDLAMRKQANAKKKLVKYLAQNRQMLVPKQPSPA